jgi:hypothetical protein
MGFLDPREKAEIEAEAQMVSQPHILVIGTSS